jgi:hypothetical protein
MTQRFLPRSYEGRRPPPKASVVIFASIGLVLFAYGFVVAFVIKPPLLGWIGRSAARITRLSTRSGGACDRASRRR